MGGGVLSGAAMAAVWAWALVSLALALPLGGGEPSQEIGGLLDVGHRALCMATHSRIGRYQGHSTANTDPRRPMACEEPYFNVFLVFNVRPCSGALLSEYYVITSAYCTEHADNGTAFMGGHKYQSLADLNKPEVQMALIYQFFHYEPKGDDHLTHDVVICRLDRKVEETATVKYAQLTSLTKWEEKRKGTLMGFGETFEGDTAHELRSGFIDLECGLMCAADVTAYKLGENALCGYNASTMFVMCWGDMGGAVTDDSGELIALISYKQLKKPTLRLCSEPPTTTYFMFLGYYRDWINSIVRPEENPEEDM